MSCPLSTHCKICPDDEKETAPSATVPEYYDDEELDRYADIPLDTLGEEAINEFREVLTTLIPSEIPLWIHSLELRHLQLPPSLHEEARRLSESGKSQVPTDSFTHRQ